MKSSKEFLQKEHSEVIRKLHEADAHDYHTKKGLVSRLVELSREMIESDLIIGVKLNDLSSYINGRLDEYGIKFPRNQDFYNLFSEKEKREYGTNSISMSRRNHEHNFEKFDEWTKKCECGIIQCCGINYEKKNDEKMIQPRCDSNPDKFVLLVFIKFLPAYLGKSSYLISIPTFSIFVSLVLMKSFSSICIYISS